MSDAHIFIMEDDPVFAKILEKRLNESGFNNIIHFQDGVEALNNLNKKPKYIFLDFSLDSLNGLDVLVRIKKVLKSTKVIMITHIDDITIKEKCLNSGASLFINKKEVLNEMPPELLKALKKSWWSLR